MFTASGLQVRFLKIIEKSNYTTVIGPMQHDFQSWNGLLCEEIVTRDAQVKWVRYITKNGEYQYRV